MAKKGAFGHNFTAADSVADVQIRITEDRKLDIFRNALFSVRDKVNRYTATRKLTWTLNWLESDRKIPPLNTPPLFRFLNISQSFLHKPCTPWVVKEKAEAVCLTRKMSECCDKGVEISVEKHTPYKPVNYVLGYSEELNFLSCRLYEKMLLPSADLVVELKGQKKTQIMKIGLPGKMYKTDDINIEVKDGLLEVTIPKVKVKRVDDFEVMFASYNNQS